MHWVKYPNGWLLRAKGKGTIGIVYKMRRYWVWRADSVDNETRYVKDAKAALWAYRVAELLEDS